MLRRAAVTRDTRCYRLRSVPATTVDGHDGYYPRSLLYADIVAVRHDGRDGDEFAAEAVQLYVCAR